MTRVVLIGDSITEGCGSSNAELFSLAPNLQRLLGDEYKVINCGKSGATLMDTPSKRPVQYKTLDEYNKAKKEIKDADERGEKIIISIMLGTNDADVASYGFEVFGEEYYNKYKVAYFTEYINLIEELSSITPDFKLIINLSPYSYDSVKHKNFGNLESIWKIQNTIYNTLYDKGFSVILNDLKTPTSKKVLKDEKTIEKFYSDWLHPSDVGYTYLSHFFYLAVKRAENI